MSEASFDFRRQEYLESLELLEMMQELRVLNNPHLMEMWRAAHSPLPAAARLRARLRIILEKRLLENRLRPPAVTLPEVPAGKAVVLGSELTTHRPVLLHRDILTRHLIIVGATGAGKTTGAIALLLQLPDVGVIFADHKDEGGRLLKLFPDALVIRADQEPVNILEAVGPREIYWAALFSEIARMVYLRIEATNEMPEVMVDICRHLKPGEPCPSLHDLVGILFQMAKNQHRPKLATVARAIKAVNVVLGKMARVRRGPDLSRRFRLIVRQYQGLPPRIHNFLTAVHVLRMQLLGSVEGHGSELHRLYISDEGTMEFGKEMSGEAGSGYVRANKRMITQVRSQGVGVVICTQLLGELEESVKGNAASLMCFCCRNPRDAQEAQLMLQLPPSAIHQIMTLPVGRAFLISDGFSGPLLFDVPYTPLGDYPSAAEIARRMQPVLEAVERDTIFSDQAESVPTLAPPIAEAPTPSAMAKAPASLPEQPLSPDERSLLDELKSAPDLGTTAHFQRLGWAFRRGHRAKVRLLAKGLIRVERQESVGGRPKELLIVLTSP